MRSSSLPPSVATTTNVYHHPAASASNINLSIRRGSIAPPSLKLPSLVPSGTHPLAGPAPAVGVHLEPPAQEKSIQTTRVTTVGFSLLGFGAQRVRVIETLGCIRSQRENINTFRVRRRFGLANLRFGNETVKIPLENEDHFYGIDAKHMDNKDAQGISPTEGSTSSTLGDDQRPAERTNEVIAVEEGRSTKCSGEATGGSNKTQHTQKDQSSVLYKLMPSHIILLILGFIRTKSAHLESPTLPTFRHNCPQHGGDPNVRDHRCSARPVNTAPYVVVGIWGLGNRVPKEVLVRIEESESLFQAMRKGIHSLHTWPHRLLSLKSIQGFTIYQCHPDKGYHSGLLPDPETRRILVELFCVYKCDEKDIHNRWLQWIQHEFNNDSFDPRKGKYAIQLVLGWSAMKFIIYGTIPIFLSLAIGLWYSFSQRGPGVSASDIVSIDQTAWTIASYIITTGGGMLFFSLLPHFLPFHQRSLHLLERFIYLVLI